MIDNISYMAMCQIPTFQLHITSLPAVLQVWSCNVFWMSLMLCSMQMQWFGPEFASVISETGSYRL